MVEKYAREAKIEQEHSLQSRKLVSNSFRVERTPVLAKTMILRDTCIWKGQLEKTRSWKLFKWKFRNEIGKNEVGKFEPKLENFLLVYTGLKTFQLRLVLSNLNGSFPT